MGVNKVIYSGQTLVDMTEDTVATDTLFEGVTAHSKSGDRITGTFTIDSELSEQQDLIEQIQTALEHKAAWSEPVLQTKTVDPSTTQQTVTPDSGYDGLSSVTVDAMNLQTKAVDPSSTSLLQVTPDDGYDGLAMVEVSIMPRVGQATPSITVDGTTGTIWAEATQIEGYVVAGTRSAQHQLDTVGASTIIPGTTRQVAVTNNKYTIGEVVVEGDSNLISSNIKSGVSIFGVSGSHEGYTGVDVSSDTVTEDTLFEGITAHDKTGSQITGTFTIDSEITEQQNLISQIKSALEGKAAGEGGSSEPVLQTKTITPSTSQQTVSPDSGYDGLSSVIIEGDSDLVSSNIKSGVNIFGVTGSYEGSGGSGGSSGDDTVLKSYITRTLTSIDFPSGITTIGAGAFSYCTGLTSVTIPTGVTKIDQSSFTYCSNLTSITIPAGVTLIGASAFERCTSLTSIELPSEVITINGYAFRYCTNLVTVSLPSGLKNIYAYAFQNCTNLVMSTLPSTLTSISAGLFNACSSIETFTIPSGITSVNSQAFYKCTGLTTVTFEGTPTSISSNVFQNCTNLTTINVPWAEGALVSAPWGATNATINYNYTG